MLEEVCYFGRGSRLYQHVPQNILKGKAKAQARAVAKATAAVTGSSSPVQHQTAPEPFSTTDSASKRGTEASTGDDEQDPDEHDATKSYTEFAWGGDGADIHIRQSSRTDKRFATTPGA